jgi:hypothetical protein
MIQLAAMPACIDSYSKCIQARNFPPACLKTFLNCDDQTDSKGLLPEDWKVQHAAIFVTLVLVVHVAGALRFI